MGPVCPSPRGSAEQRGKPQLASPSGAWRDGSDCRSQPKYRIVSAALQGRVGFRAFAVAIGVAAVAAAFAAAQAGADATTKPALTRALQRAVSYSFSDMRPRTSRSR